MLFVNVRLTLICKELRQIRPSSCREYKKNHFGNWLKASLCVVVNGGQGNNARVRPAPREHSGPGRRRVSCHCLREAVWSALRCVVFESWPAAVLEFVLLRCSYAPRAMQADSRVPGAGAGTCAPRGRCWTRLPVTGAGGDDAPRAAPLAPLRAESCCYGRRRGRRDRLKL
jgi:hypothetical protein